LNSQIIELRYSLNNLTESQIQLLFNQIEREESPIVIRRISDHRFSLSPDDIILEGSFSQNMINSLSKGYPLPLSIKFEIKGISTEQIVNYTTFEWRENPKIYCGVSLIPSYALQNYISYNDATHFINLIIKTQAPSIIRPLMAIKPKGVILSEGNNLTMVLPNHRIDFMLKWINTLFAQEITVDWLSGSSGELDQDIVKSMGSIDQSKIPILKVLIQRSANMDLGNFELIFRRSLQILKTIGN